jgi:dihydrofolate reductase
VLIVDEIVSLDGYAARPDGSIDFFLDLRDVVESVTWPERMPGVGAVLLGAQTYREFADYWPEQDATHHVNRIPKHVVSTTLDTAPWGEHEPLTVHRDAAAAVAAVGGTTDGDIIVWGSLALAGELFARGLVDELWLRVVPVAIGAGVGVLPPGDVRCDLLDHRGNERGLVTLRYAVRR